MNNPVSQIKDLLEAMNIGEHTNGQSIHDEEKLDQLADLIRTTLGVTYKDNSAYLEIAKQMTRFSLESTASPTVKDDAGLRSSYQRGRSPARSTIGDDKLRSNSTQSAARNKTFTEHASYSPSRPQNDQTPTHKVPLRQEYPPSGGSGARKSSPPRYPTTNKYLKDQNGSKAASPEEKKESESKFKRRYQQRDISSGSSPPRSVSPAQRSYAQGPPSTPKDHGRSGSRSNSPFSARPGLQEGGDGDHVSISARSPGRSCTTNACIPGAIPNVPNISSGLSSQHHHSGVPHHNRSRSQGIDSDCASISKPNPPRPHSQSPMRKPASTDDEGDKPLEQPNRACSMSPQGNGFSYIHLKDASAKDIQLPDLSKISIPDIGANGTESEGLFTPPPRSAESSFVDDPMSAYPTGSSGLKPRSAFPVGELFGNPRSSHSLPPRSLQERSPSPMEIDDDVSPPAPSVDCAFSLGQSTVVPRNGKPRRPAVPRKTVSSTTLPPLVAAAATTPDSLAFINAKREEARTYFGCKNYRSSIQAYTQALKLFTAATTELPRDTYAVLLSNRAACLLMVGAYDAAVSDCTLALQHVKMPLANEPFSNDGGFMLKVKLYTRLGRSYMKLGKHVDSARAFEDAFRTAEVASGFSKENHSKEDYRQNLEFLSQLKTDAALGQSDAKRLKDACENLTLSMQQISSGKGDRTKYADGLGHVNVALSMATGSAKLIESKLSIMAYMKRWREVAGFCERLAACNVLQDGIYMDDLEPHNPFPGVSSPRFLKADFFKNTRDEDSATRDLKLSSRAAAEAVVRLPTGIAPTYIRALRLEERYPAADSCLQSLEELMKRQSTGGLASGWLARERAKLFLTKSRREEADDLFRKSEFEKASQKYMECLVIDKEGCNDAIDGLNAGGRLHAVLHCNLAACLMARNLFHEAIEECTNALRIHGRYMKAILRRARCYGRMQQTIESISEYRRWLNLVEDRSENSYNAACVFDGPQDVKDSEISQVKKELEEVQKAKRRAEAKAKEEADRRRAQQRTFFQESYSASWRSTSGPTAQQRRDNFYGQKDDARHWDSFNDKCGARANSNPRPRPDGHQNDSSRSNSLGRASPRSSIDHYATLDIPRSASDDEIKRAYRKMALKYHPDKNKESTAGDNFRRVKLAHEVLSDPVKRREYDTSFRRPY